MIFFYFCVWIKEIKVINFQYFKDFDPEFSGTRDEIREYAKNLEDSFIKKEF